MMAQAQTRTHILCVTTAIILTACATHQENPNYEYSSRYEGAGTTTQMASSQTAPATTTVATSYQSQTNGQAYSQSNTQTNTQRYIESPSQQSATYQSAPQSGYSSQSYTQQSYSQPAYPQTANTQSSYPAGQPVYIEDVRRSEPAPSTNWGTQQAVRPAPTDSQYAGQAVSGTPGYGLFAPEEIEYDYSRNVVTARSSGNSMTASDTPETRAYTTAPTINVPAPTISGGNYVVKQGDTIYNLSKRLCVGINDVTRVNNVGQDFAIQIGQPLRLPASRC